MPAKPVFPLTDDLLEALKQAGVIEQRVHPQAVVNSSKLSGKSCGPLGCQACAIPQRMVPPTSVLGRPCLRPTPQTSSWAAICSSRLPSGHRPSLYLRDSGRLLLSWGPSRPVTWQGELSLLPPARPPDLGLRGGQEGSPEEGGQV